MAATEGLAVFHMGRGKMFTANAIAAEIWRALIAGQSNATDLAKSLAGRFGISEEQAERDISVFVAMLQAEGLVCDR